METQILSLAFMDDTVWITNNKDDISGEMQNANNEAVLLQGLEFKNFELANRGKFFNAKAVLEKRLSGLSAFRFGGEYREVVVADSEIEHLLRCGAPIVLQEEAGLELMTLKVDGGAAANAMLLQFQADQLGCPVRRPVVGETTALGAAYLAGLFVIGYFFLRTREVAK